MKKVLALILAVIMLAAIAVSAVSANDEYPTVDIRDMRLYGQDNTYLGDTPIAVAPVIDGKVELDEYQATFTISKEGEEKWEYVSNELDADINEYYAYDADNFYVAIQIPQEAGAWMYFTVHAWDSPDGNLFKARKTFGFYDADHPITWGTTWEGNEMANGTFGVMRNVNIDLAAGGWYEGEKLPAGTRILTGDWTFEEDFDVEVTTDTATNITTYEFRFAKTALAKSFRSAGADAADEIDYIGIRYQWCQKVNADTYGDAAADPSGTTRSWYPVTTESGDNASYVLDDQGLAGGDCTPHFVFAYAEPELPETEAPATDPVTDAPTATDAPKATDAPTVTDAPTATDAPNAGNDATDAPEEEGGCGGTLALSALAIVPALACGAIVARKRED